MTYPGSKLNNDQSFRILQLQPGNSDDTIHFSLQVATLSDEQRCDSYEAISYAWGDPSLTHEIYYDNSADNHFTSLKVTTSCYNALKNLRLSSQPRSIWLDAVCINQTDLDERNMQTGMMRAIYSGAHQVVVYVGESQNDSDSVMHWLEDMYEPVDYPREDISVLPPDEEAWKAFCQRPWFRRTWVLQEIINARSIKLCCGEVTVPWEALVQCYRSTAKYPYHRRQPRYPSIAVINFWTKHQSRYNLTAKKDIRGNVDGTSDAKKLGANLLDILKLSRRCLSSDPRDKLYGILPLLYYSDIDDLLRPDYGLPCQWVFTNLALYLYQENGAEVLKEGCTIHNQGSTEALPSWVPDWTNTAKERQVSLMRKTLSMGEQPNAGSTLVDIPKPRCSFSVDGRSIRQLQVQGLRIGSPVQISKECDVEKNMFPLRQWHKLARPAGIPISRVNNLEAEDFALLITHGSIVYPEAVRKAIKRIVSWETDKGNKPPLHSIMDDMCPSLKHQAQIILDQCDRRKLAVLGSGHTALVPIFTEMSDAVYVLPGASVPFVFRKRDDHFVLVGECYVQGIMHGEACDNPSMFPMESLVLE